MKKKKLEQFSPHLFLVGIVAIVAVVALVLHGGGTTGADTVYSSAESEICEDSDKDNNPLEFGRVRVIRTVDGTVVGDLDKTDFCVDSMLFQYECKSEGSIGLAPRGIQCPNDNCVDGICPDW